MEYNISKIGEIIHQHRKELKLSQTELANRIGVTRQALSKWEKGSGTEITLGVLLKLCEEFGCDFGHIVGGYPYKTRVTTDIHAVTGLSEEACAALTEIRNKPCSITFVDCILKAPPSILEKMAKKHISFLHVKNVLAPVIERYRDQIDDKKIILDASIDGEKLPQVPIQDINTYALFDLWLAFSEFINAI